MYDTASNMAKTGIVDIHGKQYQTVAYRVGKFREAHPDWTLLTEIVTRTDECVVMKATILNDQGRVLSPQAQRGIPR
jgi:hypothetical protein